MELDPAPAARQLYLGFLVVTTLLASVCAFVWFVSPLGLGFQAGPTDPTTRKIAFTAFAVSYFGGIPALVIGQVASPIFWFYRRTRGAYLAPLISIGSFLLCAGTFWFVFFKL